MSRFTIIEFPVFSNYIVHVESTSNIRNSLKKYGQTKAVLNDLKEGVDDGPNDAITVHVDDENISFIFLHPNCSTGTIAHESWHAVNRMLEHMGVKIDSEVVAYHLGYLVDKVFKFMRRK